VARVVIDITPLRRHRDFRRLWAGQVVSGVGSQLTLVAVSYQAYALTHSTLVVGLTGLVQLVPLLGGALLGGTLADAQARAKAVRAAREGALADPEGRGLEATLAVHGIAPLPPRPKVIQFMRRPGAKRKAA